MRGIIVFDNAAYFRYTWPIHQVYEVKGIGIVSGNTDQETGSLNATAFPIFKSAHLYISSLELLMFRNFFSDLKKIAQIRSGPKKTARCKEHLKSWSICRNQASHMVH
jgi:hypothetical protein